MLAVVQAIAAEQVVSAAPASLLRDEDKESACVPAFFPAQHSSTVLSRTIHSLTVDITKGQ